jgi:PAB-dependent poly(A)-specific ribonuclease subunit 2
LKTFCTDQTYLPPPQEFEFVNSVVCDGIPNHKDKEVGITTLAFDLHEDLLWAGTKSGHVTSYYGTHLQKYTSFQVHPTDEVRNILTMDDNLIILTNRTLRSQQRSGIPVFTHSSENMYDMHSLMYNSRTGRLIMGGMQNKLIEFDLTSVKELKQIDVEAKMNDNTEIDLNNRATCAILREHSRFIVSGDVPAGRVHLRDPLSLKVQHTLMAHSGMLSDFDVHGHHLVTCGNSTRNGIEQPDRFLMVYDLRILRAISPIPIHVPPYQLRFLPSMSSRIAVVSSLGQVQLVDTAALITPQTNMFQVNMSGMATGESCNTISMDISPSNQCLAFGDSLNEVYLYSSVSEPAMNPFARDTEFAEHVPSRPAMSIDDELAIYSKIPRPYLPVGQTSYLSDYWPEKFKKQAYRPTPAIDAEILKTMKVMDTGGIKVGYARNVTNMKRNQMQYPEVLKRINKEHQYATRHDFNSSEKGSASNLAGATNESNHMDSSSNTNIPKSYRKIAIKLLKFGSDDFDFDRYNRTGFCGLEASLPNSYSNAMLQILYYTEKLRILLLNHTCSRENCICCELSFLFHMMDISPGMPCQSSNFLRSLRTIAEASALGLVFADQAKVWKSNVPRLVQSWNRFILQQIHAQSSERKGMEHLTAGNMRDRIRFLHQKRPIPK